jgi:RNA polymerase sigma-54 factor
MAFTQRLELRQSQSLVMTPQLQQALKLLQLSNLDLIGYLEQELEQNPLLERAPEDAATPDEAPDEAAGGEAPADSAELATSDQLSGADDTPLDGDYDSLLDPESSSDWGSPAGNAGGGSATLDSDRGLDSQLSQEPSLREHLLAQLQMEISDPVARLIGLHLIDMLDETGYLVGELADVAELLGCEEATVEQTLTTMQGFEPPGILARDLRESLALQLADLDRLDPAMVALLASGDDRRGEGAGSQTGPGLRSSGGPDGGAGYPAARSTGRRLAPGTQQRDPAQDAGQQPVSRPTGQAGPGQGGTGLPG